MIEFKEFDESWNSRSGFDITPMLDMIFILLIFFLLTASTVYQVVSVELPEASITEEPEAQEVVLSIDQGGSMLLNGVNLAYDELHAELTAVYKGRFTTEIFIEADKSVDFGYIVEIMDICRLSGASEISFIVDRKPAD